MGWPINVGIKSRPCFKSCLGRRKGNNPKINKIWGKSLAMRV